MRRPSPPGCRDITHAARPRGVPSLPRRPVHIREEGCGESADKPDSVGPERTWRPSIWDRRCRRPRCGPPADSGGHPSNIRAGTLGSPLDLAPGGVYRADRITPATGGLLHHPFTLTTARGGGLLSVALARGSPRVGVTDHPALWSPDFPRIRAPGAIRGRLADSPHPHSIPAWPLRVPEGRCR